MTEWRTVVEIRHRGLGKPLEDGGRIIEPVFLRVRDDKQTYRCTSDQLTVRGEVMAVTTAVTATSKTSSVHHEKKSYDSSREQSAMTTTELAERVRRLEASVSNEVFERDHIIHTSMLALLTREHHFQIGVPGIAKSMLVERILSRISGFGDHDYFERLMSRQMPEDRLFGPPDLGEMMVVVMEDEDGKQYKDGGKVRRDYSRHLPAARIAFLDEIFKCSESSLNAMLKILNERVYDDEYEGKIQTDLWSVFSASNEMAESEQLDALWDRFLFRHYVDPIQDMENFAAMIVAEFDPNPEQLVSLDEFEAAQAEVKQVEITEAVVEAIQELKHKLEEQSIYPSDPPLACSYEGCPCRGMARRLHRSRDHPHPSPR